MDCRTQAKNSIGKSERVYGEINGGIGEKVQKIGEKCKYIGEKEKFHPVSPVLTRRPLASH